MPGMAAFAKAAPAAQAAQPLVAQPVAASARVPSGEQPGAKTNGTRSPRETSALQNNLDEKGDNAYYYAHRRQFEVPADAKVVSGPGLVTGGVPEQLATSTSLPQEHRISWIHDYSW